MSAEKEDIPALKIVLLGASSTGIKSSLLRRFVSNEFTVNQEAAIGVSLVTRNFEVDGIEVRLMIWGLHAMGQGENSAKRVHEDVSTETAGQERYHGITPAYFRNAHAAILGFDVTRRDTMDVCDRWLSGVRSSSSSPGCVVVAVGNKIDLADKRQISTEEARAHFEKMGVPYFETSAKTGEGVNELFEALVRLVIEGHFPTLVDDVNNNNRIAADEDEPRDKKEDKCTIC